MATSTTSAAGTSCGTTTIPPTTCSTAATVLAAAVPEPAGFAFLVQEIEPDDYRGRYKRGDPLAGAKYASEVGAIVSAVGSVAAFIAETCPSVGGQLVLPAGYLANVYELVRRAGGLCIADEVQMGLGRMGTSFWAFEAHGVILRGFGDEGVRVTLGDPEENDVFLEAAAEVLVPA